MVLRAAMRKEDLEKKMKYNRPFTAIAEEVQETMMSATSHIGALMEMLEKGNDMDDLESALASCDRLIKKFEKVKASVESGKKLLA